MRDEAPTLQLADPSSFGDRGLYVDNGSIFASVVLLIMMLAFGFNRILGLDRMFAQTAMSWREQRQEERRREIQDARLKLIKRMEEEGDGPQPSGGGGGVQGGGSPPGAA